MIRMKKLLIYLKDYKKETILAPLFKLLEACFDLLVPLVMARIIDIGIIKKDYTAIWQNCIILILLAAIGYALSVTGQYFSAKSAVGFSTALRSSVFKNIESLAYSDLDQVGSSTLIARLTSDINQIQSVLNLTLRLFLRSPFIVFGAMVMAFTVNARVAWIFVIVIPLLSIVVFGVILASIPLFLRVQKGLDRVLLRTRENLSGARVLRAFAKEEEEMSSFNEDNRQLMRMQLIVGRLSAIMNPLTYIIVNLATLMVIWVGGREVFGGVITQGAVIALVNYMSQILVELVKLANLIVNINKAIACGNRVQEVLEMKPSMEEGTLATMDEKAGFAVEFRNASMRYNTESDQALSGIDFSVNAGETVGIIGGTGAGKSTLMNLIPRFYDVCDGEVCVFGKNVKEYQYEALRGVIGIVPQKAVLFQGSIRENLLWGNEHATEEELMQAISIAQATEVIAQKGLDAHVEEGGSNFSGGQRQRLTIARALVRNPKILILDDSSSALDFATDASLRKAIAESSKGRTVFIVSQRTSSILSADRIVVLEDGEVAGIGTHEDLLKNCAVYEEIHSSQYKKEVE